MVVPVVDHRKRSYDENHLGTTPFSCDVSRFELYVDKCDDLRNECAGIRIRSLVETRANNKK